MALLRPTSFFVPSSTELNVVFSSELTERISKENFQIESLSGNIDNLEILGVRIDGDTAIIKTRPQVANSFYLLKMLSSSNDPFLSKRGETLVNDESSREIFFIGSEEANPIRDNIYRSIPDVYNLDNTLIKKTIDVQSEELFRAQKHIGEVLSDNYISVSTEGELRTRGSGAYDRLANEGAYEVDRIAPTLPGAALERGIINLNDNSTVSTQLRMPSSPIALNQEIIIDEEISLNTERNSTDGFLISLSKSNVLQLVSLKLILDGEVEDCNGNVGIDYDITKHKYSILDNKHDPYRSISAHFLDSNQILLSEFGNLPRPRKEDRVLVSYIYKDLSKLISSESIEVYSKEIVIDESVPTNSTRFFLDYAPIINASGSIAEMSGVTFFSNNKDVNEFSKELRFNISRLPSRPGEYSINYNTGEVYVYGSDDEGRGTGRKNIRARYSYKNIFENNVDFYIDNNDIYPGATRDFSGKKLTIDFSYERVFVDGVDFKNLLHIEEMNEHVENNYTSSFSLKTKNTPITKVYRIFNQTTGEIYPTSYFTDSEVYFSGVSAPKILESNSESANFLRFGPENLCAYSTFISPIFSAEITSRLSNNAIYFSPGIPSELIDLHSLDYFIKGDSLSQDIQIKFFGEANSEGIINYIGINSRDTLPPRNAKITIGTKCFSIKLNNENILSKSIDSIGSYLNTSLELSDSKTFISEKIFRKEDSLEKNISRLRRVGDYSVDYNLGIIHVAVDRHKSIDSIGSASYFSSKISTRYKNILDIKEVSKKGRPSDSTDSAAAIYNEVIFERDFIEVLDLESSILFSGGKTFDNNNVEVDTLIVLPNYTVVLPNNIFTIEGIYKEIDLIGQDLYSEIKSKRIPEMNKEDLLNRVMDGGGNIYDSSFMKIEENTVDLKRNLIRRFSKNTDGSLEILIVEKNLKFLYSAIREKNKESLFDKNRAVKKIEIEVISKSFVKDGIILNVESGVNLESIDLNGDIVVDGEENVFNIISIDQVRSTILVAPNQSSFVEGRCSVSVVAEVTVNNNEARIKIPQGSLINEGDVINLSFITNNIPEAGTKLVASYGYGKIFATYTYVQDDLYISYEYGDNQIDWSIGDALAEGQDYYVSYKYGGSREALRDNFGRLTDITFFNNLSLSVDRELYRSALKGTISSFSSGPTIPAFKNLGKSFTEIDPDINESFFGNWILGRDMLDHMSYDYDGNLKFLRGKFGTGLNFDDQTTLDIPSSSNISIGEGTASAWVRPFWGGICNDASLTVTIDNLENEKHVYKNGYSIFDAKNRYSIFDSSDAIGGTDDSGSSVSIFNYKNIDNQEKIGVFGIKKEFSQLDRFNTSNFDLEIKVSSFTPPGSNIRDKLCTPGMVTIGDKNKIFSMLLSMREARDSSGEVIRMPIIEGDISKLSIPDFDQQNPSKNCYCSILDTMDSLSTFNNHKIRLGFSSPIDLSAIVGFSSLFDNSPSVFKVIDSSGSVYKVLGLIDCAGREVYNKIISQPCGFIIGRFPENKGHISSSGSDKLNDYVPTGSISILVQEINIVTNGSDSSRILGYDGRPYIVDFSSDFLKVSFDRDPNKNSAKVFIKSALNRKKKEINLFYSSLLDAKNLNNLYSSMNMDDSDRILSNTESVNSIGSLSEGLFIGSLDMECKSLIEVKNIRSDIGTRFSKDDIYIGRSGRNPRSSTFTVNKDDFPDVSTGVPHNYDIDEGVFLGYDELCKSPVSEDAGQWIFRARANNTKKMPTGIVPILGVKELLISDIPEYLLPFRTAGLDRYIDVFGIPVFGSGKVSNSDLLYVASVLAEIVDQNRVGTPSDQHVLDNIVGRGGHIIVASSSEDFYSYNSFIWKDKGYLYGRNIFCDELVSNTFEELFQFYIEAGLSYAYPEKFGLEVGSEISANMNSARGGYFVVPPDEYSEYSWFRNKNNSCSYICQIKRYFFLGTISKLGINLEKYSEEWAIEGSQDLDLIDPDLSSMLSGYIPSVAPTGVYLPSASSIAYKNIYSTVDSQHTFTGKIITDGEFSSVEKMTIIDDLSCEDNSKCRKEFRYCGRGLLEEDGWRNMVESEIKAANLISGGSENESLAWKKNGSFLTSESGGIYRMESGGSADDIGNYISSPIYCSNNYFNYIISARVSNIDHSLSSDSAVAFSGMVSGIFSGITPVHFKNKDINIKIALGISSNNSDLILVIDAESDKIIDIIKSDWRNSNFNEYSISKSEYSDIINISINDNIISRVDISELEAPSKDYDNHYVAIHVLDSKYVNAYNFHDKNDNTSLDIDFIKYIGEENVNLVEKSNLGLIIDTDKKIEFFLKMPPPKYIDGYIEGYVGSQPDHFNENVDGYFDGYIDGYEDGYFEQPIFKSGFTEIRFSSDKLRFLLDTGVNPDSGRLSIFKDGKGFLNFRVFSYPRNNPPQIFNLATNIKHFKPGELHHIAASWRLNTPYEMDEMHLFVDGLESPNLFKFGGAIPVSINNKFSDISREVLHSFAVGRIDFFDDISFGSVVAGQSTFFSDKILFDNTYLGRSIIISDSNIAPDLIGKELIISGVSNGAAILASGDKLIPFVFNTSASDIIFSFPPTAGLNESILTDLRNSKFAIYRVDKSGQSEELGGILYSVVDGKISIIEKRTGRNPSYRVNLDTRIIEFIKKDLNTCMCTSSIDYSDSSIHIETFGLVYSRIKNQINLGGSSYRAPRVDRLKDEMVGSENIFSGNSMLFIRGSEPSDLSDVIIRKIVKDRFIPNYNELSIKDSKVCLKFEEIFDKKDNSGIMSSEGIQIYKTNLGRLIEVDVDSDNILFDEKNEITVYGDTADGIGSETAEIKGNGLVFFNKFFKSIDKITGEVFVADEEYEICTIKVLEKNPITISDNNGEAAEILSYQSGAFVLGTFGTFGAVPFELSPGKYIVDYPAHLSIEANVVGERLHIGTDINKDNSWGGVIDEFKIISEMLSDNRPTDGSSKNYLSVTSEFNKTEKSCPDEQTLALIGFDNPIKSQSRQLRLQTFLNAKTNNKFRLTPIQREVLLEKINNEEEFVYALENMGIDRDLARKVFIKAHRAAGGPITNKAYFNSHDKKVNYSRNSVNSMFGSSARFYGGSPYIIDNSKSIFRKNEGTIEFWISPLLGSSRDYQDRYYVDIFSVSKTRVRSTTPTKVVLPSSAKQIVGIHLLSKKSEMESFYKKEEIDSIFFDEIVRSNITGRLEGGSSVGKDYSVGCTLSPDGKTVSIQDALPGGNVDVVVSYVPIESNGNRISIYKDSESNLVFSIKSDKKTNIIKSNILWEKNSWHRVCCTYRANSSDDMMRMFIDGKESGAILYGDNDIVFGDGSVFGQRRGDKTSANTIPYKINISDEFRSIVIGSDNIGMQPAMARMDNIRFSRESRRFKPDVLGTFFDGDYSSNLNAAMPVISDDLTTKLINFDKEIKKDINLASVTDAKNGIFEFDINIIDSFGKIQSEEVEDLIIELAERLKPAHSNCLVKFEDNKC